MVIPLNIVNLKQTKKKHQQCLHPQDMVFNLFYAAEKKKKDSDLKREHSSH